ncbi:MAG: hypothetical protein ABIW79_02450, partial [Gemmatimonas sp.]
MTGMPNGDIHIQGPSGASSTAKSGDWLTVDGVQFKTKSSALPGPEVLLDLLSNDAAGAAVRGVLRVTQPVRSAAVLRLTVRDPDPKLAARLSNAVAAAFTESQAQRRQVGGRTTVAFIRAQLDSLDLQLMDAEVKLRDWRSAQKVVVPSAEAGNAVARSADYEERVAARRLELENIESLLSSNSSAAQSDSMRLKNGFRTVLSSPVMKGGATGSAILSTLLELESKRAELKLRRTDEDPDVQLLDKTISDYERQGQLYVGTYVNALRTEISGYQRGLNQVGVRLERFPGQELELTTLQRNADVLATLQGVLRTRLKEAEITNASNEPTVDVLDNAVPPGSPIAPILSQFLAVGVVAGILLATFGAVVRDRFDRTVHSREDIERAAGIPLVG